MRPEICLHPRPFSRDEVTQNIERLSKVFQKHHVSLAFVHGSVLYNDGVKDLDIGIFFKEKGKSSLELYTDIYFDLCSLFKADNIDVAILNDTGPAFRFDVLSKGELIFFDDTDGLADFFERTLFDYEDTRGFRRESHKELVESIREGLMKGRKINIQKITTFLNKMREALGDIQRLISQVEDINGFLSNEKKDVRELCIHHLRIALESVLDISRHIIAVKGFGIADLDTQNLIDILGRNGITPFDFSQRIRGMAGMRNAIIHVYWNLDYEKVFEMMKDRLSDFEEFARYIMDYVEKESR